jgi:hypothetical protein
MHFNAKRSWNKNFPEIDIDKSELDYEDLIKVVSHFYQNINFDCPRIIDGIKSLDRKFRNTNYYKIAFSKVINPSGKVGGSVLNKEYWLNRGWNEDYSVGKISEIQRKNSKCCEEYWISRGFSSTEAKTKVSEIQSEYSKKTNSKFFIEYWLQKGLSIEDSKKKVDETKKKRSSWVLDFWMDRGFSIEESSDIIKKNCQNSSLENLIDKHGEEIGRKKYQDINAKKARFGEDNGQFGKPAPLMSGRGISGKYKNYYFRSLTEYFAIKKFERENVKFICNDVSVFDIPCKITIKYADVTGKERNYIPDFIINDEIIVEVKNEYTKKSNESEMKRLAARQFINQETNQYKDYLIYTEKDLAIDYSMCVDDYISGNFVIDEKKIQRFFKKIGKINENRIKESITQRSQSL